VLDFTLGNIRFQQDRLEDAEKGYRAAVEKFPSFLRAHKNLGLVYARSGRMAEAIQAFTLMIELGGGDGLSFGLLGQAYAAQENFLSAESAYRQAAMLQPDSLDWKLGLARCLFKEQKFAEAAALCGELIERQPGRVDFWQLQAAAYLGMKEPMKAAQNYEILARMGKASVEMLNALGDLYVNESLMDLAVRAYRMAIEADPRQEAGRALRAGEILAARGALNQSRSVLTKVREDLGSGLDDTQRRRLLKLEARLAVAEGSDAEAVKVMEEIVAQDPLDGEALILLGQHYARGDEPERAIFYYERAESIETFEVEARIRHAQLLVGQSKYPEAVPLLKRAQEIRPSEDVARYLEQVERIARTRR
jgi:tetratricopeptide (TPR) repeat protein